MANSITPCRNLLPGILLALPLAAVGDPLTVTTRSGGIADVNPTVLYYLGLDDTIEAAELAYELTLRSTFDPVADLPGRGEWVADQSSQVLVEFRIGSMTYHYTGSGRTSANLDTPFDTGDAYRHEVELDNLYFWQTGFAPTGTLGLGGALAMRDVGGITSGLFGINAYPSNPDAPGSWPMRGKATSFSVQVMSAVPELPSYALLAAGLFVLGRRRVRALGRTGHP